MIGIYDSGLGGLQVLREMQRQVPDYDFLYFGDTAPGPFDDKSPEFVAAKTAAGLSRLADLGACLLVVADHGAAACLTGGIRDRLPVPMIDIISSGVVPGAISLDPKSLGIVGTPLVESTGAHRRAVKEALPETRIFSASAPLMSSLVDAGRLKKPETVMIVKKYLHFYKLRQVDALILGSNHYTLLMPVIQRKIGKRVAVLNAAVRLAREVKDFLSCHADVDGRCTRNGVLRVVFSDLTDAMKKNARMFYGKNIRLERI